MFSQIDPFLANVFAGFAGIVKAGILLAIAFMMANAGRTFSETATEKFVKDEKFKAIPPYVGNLVYLAVFLFFIPGICDAVGAKSIATPIVGMMNTLWGFLPNLIGACIILTVGQMIAKLVKELSMPVLQKMDVWQEKCCENPKVKLSQSIANVIYVLILIPVIIATLEVLRLGSMTRPAVMMLEEVMTYIPLVVGALLIAFVGMVVGKLAGNLVHSLISATGIDARVSNLIGKDDFSLSNIIGHIVHVLLVVFFSVEALAVLRLKVLTKIGIAVVEYIPNVLGTIVILLGAYILTGILSKMFSCKKLVTIGVYFLATVMVLSQLQIASGVVNTAFLILLFGVSMAFAIAVGRGGSDAVKDYLSTKKCKCCESEEPTEHTTEE